MKKHNDGYVLPFVLVVLVVVCFVAVTLMSSALTNLQRQKASVQRMEDKYVAQDVAALADSVNCAYEETIPEDATEEQKKPKYAVESVLTKIFGAREWNVALSETFSYEEDISFGAQTVKVSVTIAPGDVSSIEENGAVVGYKVTVNGSVQVISPEGGDAE